MVPEGFRCGICGMLRPFEEMYNMTRGAPVTVWDEVVNSIFIATKSSTPALAGL